jgi:thiamine pyrophosphate-dependent acetolactate synthase large subunit-like protein
MIAAPTTRSSRDLIMSTNLNGGQAAIALLETYGVDTVFGIPGVHTLDLYRGLAESKIRHVAVRHEQGAGFMADGYARASGRPGVCVLITGPGVTNAATPIGQAFSDSVPMLVLSSVNATTDLGKGRGRLHEITSQQAAMAPLTAFSRTVRDNAELAPAMADAFAVFETKRPRPVHIELPLDLLSGAAPRPPAERERSVPPQPDPAAIVEAAALIQSAKRPFVIAGGGASEAGASLHRIVERLGAPVAVTTAAKGLVPDSHPLCLGCTLALRATQELLADADVVLAVGTELAETDSWIDRLPIRGKLIRIDIDAYTLTRDYPPAVAIRADAATTLSALVAQLGDGAARGPAAGALDGVRERNASLGPLQRKHALVLDEVRKALPDDGIVASDMTQIAYTGVHYFPCRQPRTWYHPAGYGTLGYAMPAAIGAKLGAPQRDVVAIAGDAGFLFTVQELATAVELKLPIAILLWNNDALGQIAGDMVARGIPEIGVKQRNPDYLALARAFGARALRPRSLGALRGALKRALRADGPTLIEVREDSPFLS